MRWRRLPGGYLREDGAWFLSRGARMTHGNNAWLIHQRVAEGRIGRDSLTAYDTSDGSPLWAVDETGYTETVDAAFTGPLYAHTLDAGSLAEAKYAVETVEARETSCRCMTEDPGDGFGERVVTHSSLCPQHPDAD